VLSRLGRAQAQPAHGAAGHGRGGQGLHDPARLHRPEPARLPGGGLRPAEHDRAEQGERLRERLDDPAKQWKFRPEDLEDRRRFGKIEAADEEALTKTSTRWAPWYVVPADHRWVRNAAVTGLLLHTLREMRPQFPDVTVDLEQFVID
jgi:hypothetical protein